MSCVRLCLTSHQYLPPNDPFSAAIKSAFANKAIEDLQIAASDRQTLIGQDLLKSLPGLPMPENEAQSRALAKIGSDNQIATTWTKVVKQARNRSESQT
jgi:hypothetical protein